MNLATIIIDPVFPAPTIMLLAIAFVLATIYVYKKVGAGLSKPQHFMLGLLRIIGVTLVVLILLRPSKQITLHPPTVEKFTFVALDGSRSMNQRDVDGTSRFEAARELLYEAGVIDGEGRPVSNKVRLFEFHENALPTSSFGDAKVGIGDNTLFHNSVNDILGTLRQKEGANAIFMLSDGHDFQLVNPGRTGFIARSRQAPIFAIPFGDQGAVRDVAVQITNYQPYCYKDQKARINAMLRMVGCEYEKVLVRLLRKGETVQRKVIEAEDHRQLPIHFEVSEAEVGQYEYEIQVAPITNEANEHNNSAVTFLNVVDQQLSILVLEAEPYWDSTFLHRSLRRNDKFDVNVFVRYTDEKVHVIQNHPTESAFSLPETREDFLHYAVIILGRSVQDLLSKEQVDMLEEYVRENRGVVIFSRGRAFEGAPYESKLEPVLWSEAEDPGGPLVVTREGKSLAPFRILQGEDDLPDLLGGRVINEPKTLSAQLAGAPGGSGIVQRRYGNGQVLSIGVDGLWRWAFNANVDEAETLFDRFWDQMVLWMLAGRDFTSQSEYTVRASAANILLGEKVYFRLLTREPKPDLESVPITLYLGEDEVARSALSKQADARYPTGYFVPEQLGKYRAIADLPDGGKQELRFVVYEENFEETEVTVDKAYLEKLCKASGGRVVQPDELKTMLTKLSADPIDAPPRIKLNSLWDRPWVFALIVLCLGTDWYLRRRWGLC